MSAVQVRLARLEASAGAPAWARLRPPEVARAARFSRRDDADAWVGGRDLARRVVAARLGVDPAEVDLGRSPCPGCGSAEHGPPLVAGIPWLRVSTSRSGRLAAVAVGEVTVGIDLEPVSSAADLAISAPSFVGVALDDRLALRAWVRLEAVLKAAGIGVVTDLTALDVSPASPGPVLVDGPAELAPARWLVEDLDAGADLVVALARPAGDDSPVDLAWWA